MYALDDSLPIAMKGLMGKKGDVSSEDIEANAAAADAGAGAGTKEGDASA